MKPSRAARLVTAVIAVISLLFTQLALASYACPGLTMPARMAMVQDSAMADMSHCSGMDRGQPSLCQAYGHTSHQSLDKPDLPQIPPFHAAGLVLTIVPPDPAVSAPDAPMPSPALARATAPPLAIRHCCLRI